MNMVFVSFHNFNVKIRLFFYAFKNIQNIFPHFISD